MRNMREVSGTHRNVKYCRHTLRHFTRQAPRSRAVVRSMRYPRSSSSRRCRSVSPETPVACSDGTTGPAALVCSVMALGTWLRAMSAVSTVVEATKYFRSANAPVDQTPAGTDPAGPLEARLASVLVAAIRRRLTATARDLTWNRTSTMPQPFAERGRSAWSGFGRPALVA